MHAADVDRAAYEAKNQLVDYAKTLIYEGEVRAFDTNGIEVPPMTTGYVVMHTDVQSSGGFHEFTLFVEPNQAI